MEDFEDFTSEAGPKFPPGSQAIGQRQILPFDFDLDLEKIKPMYRKATEEELTPKTPQGTSLVEVPDSDIFSLLDAVVPDASTTSDFLSSPLLFSYTVLPEKVEGYKEGIDKVLVSMKQEQDRVENVLKDVLGERYQGINANTLEGFDLFTTRDQLARKDFFEDRKKYFEDKYPGSEYFRVQVGNNKREEVFSLVADGEVYRVDPKGGFGDIMGDIGDVTGTVGTLSTAGAIIGSYLHALFGTAGGYVIGDMIDKQLAQEGIDESRDEFFEQFTGSQALQGLVEGVINQFAPGAGKYIVAKLKGEEAGVPFNMLLKKVPEEGLEAQKFAEKSGLPLLGVAQLATKSNLGSKLYAQAAGLSRRVTELRLNQQEKILKKLEAKANAPGGFNAFSQAELENYVFMKGNQYNNDLLKFMDETFNMKINPDSTKVFQKITEDATNLKKALDLQIDKKFLQASQKANSAGATFDLSPAVAKAKELLYGIRTRAKPDPKNPADKSTVGLNIPGGDLGNQLQRLVNILDPTVSKLVTTDLGATKTFSALKQITTIRNDLSDLIQEGGSVGRQAKEIVELIDQTITNPTVKNNVFGKDMIKFMNEGKKLFELRTGVVHRSNFKEFFTANGRLQPRKVVSRIFNGDVDEESFGLFLDFVKNASKNKTMDLVSQKVLKDDFANAFINYATHNPGQAGDVIGKLLQKQPNLIKELFPSQQARAKLAKFSKDIEFLDGSVFKELQKKALTNLETAKSFIEKASAKEIEDFVNASGGFNDPKVAELRHAVLDNIFKNPSLKGTSPMAPGVEVVNAKALVDEMNQLTNFSTDKYAKLKPLFVNKANPKEASEYLKNLKNIRNYTHFTQEALDTGGQMATGARVGALINNLDLGAIATIMKADLLAKALSTPPTVAQLEKVFGQSKFSILNIEKLTPIFNAIAREYGLTDFGDPAGKEAPAEEIKRTGEPIQTSEVQTNTITPNTLNLNLPTVSGGGSVGSPPSSTNFASLFPFDTTGSAISSRAGIGGLV